MYRQGDILLITADTIPPSALKQDDGVLANGEASGHRHEVLSGASVWVGIEGTKYLEVPGKEAQLRHEEHGPIMLPGPAIYRVIWQREYSPGRVFHVDD